MYRHKLQTPRWFRKRLGGENFRSNLLKGNLKRGMKTIGADHDSTLCDSENLGIYEDAWNEVLSMDRSTGLPKVSAPIHRQMVRAMEEDAEDQRRDDVLQSEAFRDIERILSRHKLSQHDLRVWLREKQKLAKKDGGNSPKGTGKANQFFQLQPKLKLRKTTRVKW